MTTSTAIDYTADIAALVAELRLRDTDPAYADAPVFDVYARISRLASSHDEEKTPRQVAACLKNLLGRHARLGEVQVDNNRSAWKLVGGNRPAFEAMLVRIESGAVQGVLCWHVDRLARQPWDLERLLRLVLQRREREAFLVASCHGDHLLSNVFELRMKMMFAAQESEAKSRRIRDLNARRREAGVLVGGASAFGHRNEGELISDTQLAAERDAVAWGIRALIAGRSLGYVAREFSTRGLLTRRGVAFNALNVRSCLYLARHAGLIEHEDEELRPMRNADEVAIVTRDEFLGLRAMFAAREGTKGRTPGDRAHFLSNLIRCDGCGRGMSGSTINTWLDADGNARRVYRCRPQNCRGVSVDADVAEEWVRVAVVGILASPDHARTIARKSRRVAELEADIERAESRVARLMGLGRVNPDRFEFYAEQAEVFEADRRKAVEERDALVAAGAGRTARALTEADLEREWAEATPAERRALTAQALPEGFHVARTGRAGARWADPTRRFAVPRGVATARLAEEARPACP